MKKITALIIALFLVCTTLIGVYADDEIMITCGGDEEMVILCEMDNQDHAFGQAESISSSSGGGGGASVLEIIESSDLMLKIRGVGIWLVFAIIIIFILLLYLSICIWRIYKKWKKQPHSEL